MDGSVPGQGLTVFVQPNGESVSCPRTCTCGYACVRNPSLRGLEDCLDLMTCISNIDCFRAVVLAVSVRRSAVSLVSDMFELVCVQTRVFATVSCTTRDNRRSFHSLCTTMRVGGACPWPWLWVVQECGGLRLCNVIKRAAAAAVLLSVALNDPVIVME